MIAYLAADGFDVGSRFWTAVRWFLLLTLCCVFLLHAGERAQIIVDAKGGGSFRTIQEALNSLEPGSVTPVTILIKNGVYREKVFITRSHVNLVGEHRDSTKIIFPELRSAWIQAHGGDDWGSAVVNIGDGVSDITLANLTVYNNYGALNNNHDHQFAIRGFNATRIAFLHCTVIADGGDTVSLWDSTNGMYYHASCSFEGWVDYVCPRGWCYVTDSKFFGHNKPSASLWHDGSMAEGQKFVIRNSFFDGVEGFPLGRHHKDAQFFLIGCTFSEQMADKPFYSPKSPNVKPWIWGARHYFYDCHRRGGDFAWFSDNLDSAKGSPLPQTITAFWTFDGQWDPEMTLSPVLPFAAIPRPANKSMEVQTHEVRLIWIPGRNGKMQRVYFGETNPPSLRTTQQVSTFQPKTVKESTTYYWRVDTMTDEGTIQGETWQFSTAANELPGAHRK